MNTSVRYSPNYSVADYQRWEGYWELIDGVAVDMGLSPFGPHGAMAARLATAFVSALDRLSAVDFCVIQEVDCCSFQLSEGFLPGVDFSKLKLN